MKRNPVLIKQILEILHESEDAFVELKYDAFDGFFQRDVINQMLLLIDGHFIVVGDVADGEGCYPLKVRITWQGCDWLEQQNHN